MPDTQPKQQPQRSMFSAGSKKQDLAPQLPPEILDLGQRVRLLEERFANLRNKVGVMDQNMLNNSREEKKDIMAVHSELDEMNRTINDLKDKMKLMIEEIKTLARDEELQVIKKYLEYWQPVEFVTRKELRGVLGRLKEDINSKN